MTKRDNIMGIPSYFSYIIKNHSNIIRSLQHHQQSQTSFAALYMDCNSIIYDAFREL
jgi:5'-3' exonuclease